MALFSFLMGIYLGVEFLGASDWMFILSDSYVKSYPLWWGLSSGAFGRLLGHVWEPSWTGPPRAPCLSHHMEIHQA